MSIDPSCLCPTCFCDVVFNDLFSFRRGMQGRGPRESPNGTASVRHDPMSISKVDAKNKNAGKEVKQDAKSAKDKGKGK